MKDDSQQILSLLQEIVAGPDNIYPPLVSY